MNLVKCITFLICITISSITIGKNQECQDKDPLAENFSLSCQEFRGNQKKIYSKENEIKEQKYKKDAINLLEQLIAYDKDKIDEQTKKELSKKLEELKEENKENLDKKTILAISFIQSVIIFGAVLYLSKYFEWRPSPETKLSAYIILGNTLVLYIAYITINKYIQLYLTILTLITLISRQYIANKYFPDNFIHRYHKPKAWGLRLFYIFYWFLAIQILLSSLVSQSIIAVAYAALMIFIIFKIRDMIIKRSKFFRLKSIGLIAFLYLTKYMLNINGFYSSQRLRR